MWLYAVLRFKKPEKCYNHFEVGFGEMTSGAIKEGIQVRKWDDYVKEHKGKFFKYVEYELNLNEEEKKKGLEYLKETEGTPYEFANFIWHFLKIITGKWEGNETDRKLFCYEHGIRFLNATGKYDLNPYLNPYQFKKWADKNLKKQVSCKKNRQDG